jgi:L-malate glycosyltransferase
MVERKRELVYIQSPFKSVHRRSDHELRILQISSAQLLGGGERHLADLANGLVRRGHELYVALRPGSPLLTELWSENKQNVITLALRNALDANSARQLMKAVKKYEIEIVHAHMARDYPLAAFAIRRNPTARLIVTRHVLFELNRLHRITLSKAARVIAVSHAVASQLIHSRIVPESKISVVMNGIDTKRFRRARANADRQSFLRKLNFPDACLLVATVGELTPLKGHAEFLRAAARIIQSYPNAYFVIAGIDSSREQKHHEELLQTLRQLDLSGRVRIVPWLDDIAELYCALDVFVSASHTESFGLAIAEAMATGTAVVATATDGAQEILSQGETGLLVPIGDEQSLAEAIGGLLGDESKRRSLGAAAQRRAAESFDVKRMIEETEQIYRSVIEAR